jgi:hypothetical protein
MEKPATIEPQTAELPAVSGPVCEWVATRLNDLQTEAKLLVDDYWARLKQGRAGQKRYARGKLGVRLRARDTGAFSIEWYEMGVLGGTGRSIARKQLNKGRAHRYALDQTLKSEPEWIANLVQEAEDAFAEIRKRQALLVDVRDALVAYESEVSGKAVTASMIVGRGLDAGGNTPTSQEAP